MGENLPGYDREALNWLEARIANWALDPDVIGLSDAIVADLEAKITEARTALVDADTIRGLAKNATVSFKVKAHDMRHTAALAIARIKNQANNAPNPEDIYDAASVSPPASRTPVGPPSQPSAIVATLNGDGSVTIHFEATGPTGTTWHVTRKLAGETSLSFVGVADPATKSFMDLTIPAGSASAAYQVQGVRGTLIGPVSFEFNVAFGSAKSPMASAAAA